MPASGFCRFLPEVLGLSLFLDLPLGFCEFSPEANADFRCFTQLYWFGAGLGACPSSLLSLGQLLHSIDL